MNWDIVEGNWKQLKGKAREQWGKLTDSDFEQIAGKKDQLIGRIQERYGISKDEAQKQADEWVKVQRCRQPRDDAHHRQTLKRYSRLVLSDCQAAFGRPFFLDCPYTRETSVYTGKLRRGVRA